MSSYTGWRGLFAGLNSAFASLTTGLGGPSDAATSVQLVERRAPMSTDTLKAWSEHAVYSRLCAALPGAALSGGAPPAGGLSLGVLTVEGEPEPAQTARLTAQAEDLGLVSTMLDFFTASLREGVAGLWLLDPTEDQREPLNPETCRIGRLHVVNRFDMTPAGGIVSDAMSPFYGWPEFVKVAPRMGNRRAEPVVCHISRVLCVAGLKPISTYNKTQDEWDGYGRPLCSMLGDSIKYAETGVITGAGLVQRIQQSVLKLNPKTMSEAKVNRSMRELLERRLELFAEARSTQGVVMLMEGETYEAVNARTEGFDGLVKTLTDHLVMQWGIPRAIVTGEQVGGLTASSAPYMDAWGLRVNAYRGEISPAIEYVARCLLSTIGAPGSNFRVEWAALTPANALTEAQAQQAKVQTAATMLQSGLLGVTESQDWLRAQGLDLPEAAPDDYAAQGEQIAEATPTPTPTGVTPAPETQSNSATDAAPADSLWIGAVPAADVWEQRLAPIRAAVAEILPGFEADAEPHLTVMYLGAVGGDVADLAVDEAQRAMRRMLAEPGDLPAFHGARVSLMATQEDGRRAVALSGEAWGLYQVRDDLQAALGDLIAPDVRRFPTWRPHVTLGYATSEITPAQRERIAVVLSEGITLPIAQVTVRADGETPLAVLKTFDAAAPIAPPEVRQAARAALAARDSANLGYAPAVWAALCPVARGEPVNAALLRSLAGSSAPGAAWAQGIVDAPAE